MMLFWMEAICPRTHEVLYREYFFSREICEMTVRQWVYAGMNVRTWSNYKLGW